MVTLAVLANIKKEGSVYNNTDNVFALEKLVTSQIIYGCRKMALQVPNFDPEHASARSLQAVAVQVAVEMLALRAIVIYRCV